jgi:hypothetical protein
MDDGLGNSRYVAGPTKSDPIGKGTALREQTNTQVDT